MNNKPLYCWGVYGRMNCTFVSVKRYSFECCCPDRVVPFHLKFTDIPEPVKPDKYCPLLLKQEGHTNAST